MSKRVFSVSILVVVLTLIVGVIMFNQNFSAEGANPSIHKKDLSEHGLLVIASTDSTFETDVNKWLNDKQGDFRRFAHILKPFSIFVKNTTDKDVIAYRLNWQMKMSDGKVANYPRTYFAPTYLMGVPRSDLYDRSMKSVKKGDERFFTMIPTSFEMGESSNAGASGSGEQNDRGENFQRANQSGDMGPIIAKLSEQLHQATDITVTIESALFDDGAFVGPSGDPEFVKLKASITAKHDLLNEIKAAVREGRVTMEEVLKGIADIAAQEIAVPTSDSDFEAYYSFFRKLQAEEVTSVRTATGDDTRTVGIFLHRLDHEWIIPFERSQP